MKARKYYLSLFLFIFYFQTGYCQFVVKEGTTEYLKVEKSTGNVGIGLGTANPEAKLDVLGTIKFRSLVKGSLNNPVLTVDADGDLSVVEDQHGSGADGVVTGVTVSGTGTKTITLNRSIGAQLSDTFTDLTEDADANPDNERQRLSYDPATRQLAINNGGNTSGNSVPLSMASLTDGAGINDFSYDGSANRTISHANTSDEPSSDNGGRTVIQDVILDGFGHVTDLRTTTLADNVDDADASVANEIQTLNFSTSSRNLSITNGNQSGTLKTVTLPDDRVTKYHSRIYRNSTQSLAGDGTLTRIEYNVTNDGKWAWLDGINYNTTDDCFELPYDGFYMIVATTTTTNIPENEYFGSYVTNSSTVSGLMNVSNMVAQSSLLHGFGTGKYVVSQVSAIFEASAGSKAAVLVNTGASSASLAALEWRVNNEAHIMYLGN